MKKVCCKFESNLQHQVLGYLQSNGTERWSFVDLHARLPLSLHHCFQRCLKNRSPFQNLSKLVSSLLLVLPTSWPAFHLGAFCDGSSWPTCSWALVVRDLLGLHAFWVLVVVDLLGLHVSLVLVVVLMENNDTKP